jgi:hypothetical protein
MTREKQAGSKRARRTFSPEFKLEAVRLLRERRAAGASLAQVARDYYRAKLTPFAPVVVGLPKSTADDASRLDGDGRIRGPAG